jgi:serine/threonine protein kinase
MNEQKREHFRRQFMAEAQLLFKLSASLPNVVRPLHIDAITAPNGRFMPFMALEWLEGETLDAMVTREGAIRPLSRLIELLTPAADVLTQAHHFPGDDGPVSIVHRDIKPENLFLADVAGKKVLKVLDFGISKAKSVATQVVGRASADTAPYSPFTPAYGAPEQWAPKRFGQSGPWTDVFGLALTTVELLAGRPIFDGDATSMLAAVLDTERRPTPLNEGVDVSSAVDRVFERALAVDPRDRYRDAGSFWRELRDAVGLGATGAVASARDTAPASSNLRISNGELIFREPSSPPPSLQLASLPPGAPVNPGSEVLGAPSRLDNSLPQRVASRASAADSFDDSPLKLPAVSIRPNGTLWRECLVPTAAILAGLVLAALGQYHAAVSGNVFSLGPVRLGWFTVPLVVLGSAGFVLRLLQGRGVLGRS